MTDGCRPWSDPLPRPVPPEGAEMGPPPDRFPPDLPPTSGYRYDIRTAVPYAPEVPEPYREFDPETAN